MGKAQYLLYHHGWEGMDLLSIPSIAARCEGDWESQKNPGAPTLLWLSEGTPVLPKCPYSVDRIMGGREVWVLQLTILHFSHSQGACRERASRWEMPGIFHRWADTQQVIPELQSLRSGLFR